MMQQIQRDRDLVFVGHYEYMKHKERGNMCIYIYISYLFLCNQPKVAHRIFMK